MPAVETRDLTRVYGDRTALDRVTFAVAPGETFSLLGPNGGGKTTLFRILATLLPPTSGTFLVDGLGPGGDVRALRRRLGVVFQSPSLDKKLTVGENLTFGGEMYGLSGRALGQRIDELLARLRVAERKGDRVETLSGGLARRVEIAKSLLHRPKILLLDEPSTGLDPGARRDLRALLSDVARQDGTAVLLTTHLFDEAEVSDRIGILDRGRLLALGTPAELKATLGGDVLVVEAHTADDAAPLAREIGARFGEVSVLGASVRLQRESGHELIPSLVEAFPGRFKSVTLGAPSLEDVFIAKTGHAFTEAEA